MGRSTLGILGGLCCALTAGCAAPGQRAVAVGPPPASAPPTRPVPPDVPPDVPAPAAPFVAAGCRYVPSPRGHVLDCTGVRETAALGCVAEHLVLEPLHDALPHPIARCVMPQDGTAREPGSGLFRDGCMHGSYRRYLVARDGRFRIVRSAAELAAELQPITTPEQAIAFASAVTGAEPRQALPPRHVLAGPSFLPTTATPSADGFDVRLFETRPCGCGPHPTRERRVHVARSGGLTVHDGPEVYRDTSTACID